MSEEDRLSQRSGGRSRDGCGDRVPVYSYRGRFAWAYEKHERSDLRTDKGLSIATILKREQCKGNRLVCGVYGQRGSVGRQNSQEDTIPKVNDCLHHKKFPATPIDV
uniref:FLYWCH-type domain-containing protein n=1 Tax=Steinernema glaseri TaxID=37863 RepID=A0A1I7Y3L0_9BILA